MNDRTQPNPPISRVAPTLVLDGGTPGRLAEVSDDERHATGKVAQVLDGDVMHRLRSIESGVRRDVAVQQDLACELTGTGAEFEDAELAV